MSLPNVGRNVWMAVGAAVAFAAWLVADLGDPATDRWVSDGVFLCFGVLAVWCAFLAARRSLGRQRLAWAAMTVGLTGWLLADGVKAFYPLWAGPVPFPSPADVGYLILPVAACVALAALPSGRSSQSSAKLLLDGFIVVGSLFLVIWVVVLRQQFGATVSQHFANGVALAYPIADLVVITVGVLVLIRARAEQRTSVTFVLVGIVLMAVSNDVYFRLTATNDYARGDILDLGWAAALLSFALAALTAAPEPIVDIRAPLVPTRLSSWLPYVPLALASVVATVDLLNASSAVVVVGAITLIGAVLMRQFLVIGENRSLLAIVADQALRDPLTGLANRFLFQDRLNVAAQLRRHDSRTLAVISLDLDDFKLVNDGLGHPAGDALLIQVADRITSCVRAGDTVARLGGDEFAILVDGGGPTQPGLVAQRVVAAFDKPFVVDGEELLIWPSVGLSTATGDDGHVCADTLLKQSDMAMYAAKRTRSQGARTFDPDMHLIDVEDPNPPRERASAGRHGRAAGIQLLGQLRRAIDGGELTVEYQPQFDLTNGEIIGAEALVRWPHPERGLLSPHEFLPLVRGNGLMDVVTELVLSRALSDAAGWQALGSEVPVAVNLFAPSLSDGKLPSRVAAALATHGLDPAALTLEITEELEILDCERTRAVLRQLRDGGTRISIDDFGSGFSGLRYLRELPIDEVKLDRQFIAPIIDNARAATIVRAVVDLAHSLDLRCVAEGVESEAIVLQLRDFGCDVAQGFYYRASVSAPTLLDLVANGARLPVGP